MTYRLFNRYDDEVELTQVNDDLWKMTVNNTLDTNFRYSYITDDEIYSADPDGGPYIHLGSNKIDVFEDNELKPANIFVYGIELKSDGLYLKISNFTIINSHQPARLKTSGLG